MNDPFTRNVVKRDARDFARKRRNSALDETRSNESNDFSQDAQDAFSGNERGSEDLMDMYEKGAFD
jgi:hypothetical protein